MAKTTKSSSRSASSKSVRAKATPKAAVKRVVKSSKSLQSAKSAKSTKLAKSTKSSKGRPKLNFKASVKAPKVKRLTQERSQAVGLSLKNLSTENQDYPFSGKFTVRLPKSLHQALVERSKREGVSLNLFVTNSLSRTVASGGALKKKTR